MTITDKAKLWFGVGIDIEKFISPQNGFPPIISIERVVEYYLRRFPWEKE